MKTEYEMVRAAILLKTSKIDQWVIKNRKKGKEYNVSIKETSENEIFSKQSCHGRSSSVIIVVFVPHCCRVSDIYKDIFGGIFVTACVK